MPSDYGAIAAENIRRYGDDPILLELLTEIYSDRTHFVFELLQNAEDAGATRIAFLLHRDRLEVRHDGKIFDEADVRGLCGVGKGTKKDDLTKIGKFGIGFKSVHAYTDRPEIHSGDEHFHISAYVQPTATDPGALSKAWTTQFVFPFSHREVAPDQAFRDIRARLVALHSRTLLFLHSITSITWSAELETGQYVREDRGEMAGGRRILLKQTRGGQDRQEQWLVFTRPVQAPEGQDMLSVEAAYKLSLDQSSNNLQIVTTDDTHLVVSFPTEKETHLGFLIQGPYQTTPARDNVPVGAKWNQHMVRETAALVVTTLLQLRDAGLMNISFLTALPIDARRFPEQSMFRPIYDGVRLALRSEALLPTDDGEFAAAVDAKLARGAALIDLLTPIQLGDLMGRNGLVRWIDRNITEGRTATLYSYLRGGPTVEPLIEDLELDAAAFARRLNDGFLAKQSDDWMVRLYGYLGEQPGVWRLIRSRRIIRLESGEHVAPFNVEDRPNAFLPPNGDTAFPIVRRDIARYPRALQFFKGIGLGLPDMTAEVSRRLLPRYTSSVIRDRITAQEHRANLVWVCEALERGAGIGHSQLLEDLRKTPILYARNLVTGERTYREPPAMYMLRAGLPEYFAGNAEIWFLDEEFKIPNQQLSDMGVHSIPLVRARKPDSYEHVPLRSTHGDHARGLQRFDPNATVEGLEHAVKNITVEKARFIWNEILVRYNYLVRGTVETATLASYLHSQREERLSPIGRLLINAAWLPNPDGTFREPKAFSLDDLPAGFVRDSVVATVLGMQTPELKIAAEVTGLQVSTLQLISAHPEEVEQFAQGLRLRDQNEIDDDEGILDPSEPAIAATEFVKALREKFHHPGVTRLTGDSLPNTTPVRDPEARRAIVRQQIEEAQKRGPVKRQFSKVPMTIWDRKDSAVRSFLHGEYLGHCQICGTTFLKTDGTPYFEGLYLVPRLNAEWHDREGNVLSLCANCCAKLQFGAVEADDLIEHIMAPEDPREDGLIPVPIKLLDERTEIGFTHRHMLDLQEMIKAST